MVSSDIQHLILTVVGLLTAVGVCFLSRMVVRDFSSVFHHLTQIYTVILKIQKQQAKAIRDLHTIMDILEMRGVRMDRIEDAVFVRPKQEHEIVN